ncbi:hypothetical protein AHAS_Ahas05G0165900 [Arachis hypogaea]
MVVRAAIKRSPVATTTTCSNSELTEKTTEIEQGKVEQVLWLSVSLAAVTGSFTTVAFPSMTDLIVAATHRRQRLPLVAAQMAAATMKASALVTSLNGASLPCFSLGSLVAAAATKSTSSDGQWQH